MRTRYVFIVLLSLVLPVAAALSMKTANKVEAKDAPLITDPSGRRLPSLFDGIKPVPRLTEPVKRPPRLIPASARTSRPRAQGQGCYTTWDDICVIYRTIEYHCYDDCGLSASWDLSSDPMEAIQYGQCCAYEWWCFIQCTERMRQFYQGSCPPYEPPCP